MQISGAIDFFSQIASRNLSVSMGSSSFLPSQPQFIYASWRQTDGDSLSISETGREFSLNVKKAPALTENRKAGANDKTEIKNALLKIADKSMSLVQNALEKMHELAVFAQRDDITDLDRVNLQIELEELRKQLEPIPRSMMAQEQGGAPVTRMPETTTRVAGDGSSILDRMRNRIINKQEWDVREAFTPEKFGRVTEENDEEIISEVFAKNKWYVVGDEDVLTQEINEEGKIEIEVTDATIPTVRERLERETPVILMDAESAAAGAKNLERHIDSIKKWRDSIAEADAYLQSDESNSDDVKAISPVKIFYQAYHYLNGDELYSGRSLNRADAPNYFLYEDGVYDHVQVVKPLLIEDDPKGDWLNPALSWQKNAEREGRIISYAQAEREAAEYAAEKAENIAGIINEYNGYQVDIEKLNELNEGIIATNLKQKQMKTVYITPTLGQYFNAAA